MGSCVGRRVTTPIDEKEGGKEGAGCATLRVGKRSEKKRAVHGAAQQQQQQQQGEAVPASACGLM